MVELPKGFDHAVVDPQWYAFWEQIGAFRARPDVHRPHFSMVLPPPNVTGSLHIGHALNQTLPDILVRWKRMLGFDVLWLPGTDHAGIATQNVVEKQLAGEGKTRHDLGREAFEARVWNWVRQSRATITSQMRKLGSSVDWSRERFTLDAGLSRAVRREFVSLYQAGLIYRGNYIVNWCPRCRTALSDLEVVHRETVGKLYHVRYRAIDGGDGLVVATTRPETMLGDTGVAVHPDDERYRVLVGTRVRLPVVGRELPIVADDAVDPAFGTGAVKVTPAHDPNDFLIGRRHQLPQIQVIDEDARMTPAAGSYAGLDRFAARSKLVADLERDGALENVTEHRHAVGHCERCNAVVEPLASMQWFVKIKPLAEEAVRAVEQGRIRFLPEHWTKTYYEWMTNIHDWCISRQLWWGHRIPAWYCLRCGEVIVAEEPPDACPCGGALRQDNDVLDTWFSSGLWPFSTLGWPDDTDDLRTYYPTDLLITGLDIIFFWVARMIMLGLRFTGDVPFRDVYITALVRDEHGQKMSKSRGNVVDPLQIMDEIGADAFRFTLAAMASPGMDIALSEGRLTGYRQFINKIWNASRFVFMHVGDRADRPSLPSGGHLILIHRWILHSVSRVATEVTEDLAAYRFDIAAQRLYQFFWHEYADWYIELVKPHLQAEGPERETALAVIIDVHDRILRLLHPFIPFVTEELWQKIPRQRDAGETITLAPYPAEVGAWNDYQAVDHVGFLKDVITEIRTVRAERSVPPSKKIAAVIDLNDPEYGPVAEENAAYIKLLAGLHTLEFGSTVPADASTVKRVLTHVPHPTIYVSLAGTVDRGAEVERLRKELANIARESESLDRKLSNENFVERAPATVVQEARDRMQHLAGRRAKLEDTLKELGG